MVKKKHRTKLHKHAIQPIVLFFFLLLIGTFIMLLFVQFKAFAPTN